MCCACCRVRSKQIDHSHADGVRTQSQCKYAWIETYDWLTSWWPNFFLSDKAKSEHRKSVKWHLILFICSSMLGDNLFLTACCVGACVRACVHKTNTWRRKCLCGSEHSFTIYRSPAPLPFEFISAYFGSRERTCACSWPYSYVTPISRSYDIIWCSSSAYLHFLG